MQFLFLQNVVSATKSRDGRQIDRTDALLSAGATMTSKLFRSNPSSNVHPPTGTRTRKTYDFTSELVSSTLLRNWQYFICIYGGKDYYTLPICFKINMYSALRLVTS